jgi:diadenosine tetraphosphate (Ap4A) HIT family hydrolase
MNGAEGLETFVSALPQGDVLVAGAAAASAAAIARHGVRTVFIDPAARVEGEPRAPLPGVIRRPLGAATLPYPPGIFAGCWLAAGSPVAPAEARRLLHAGGVLALADASPEGLAGPDAGTGAGGDADCVFCPELRFWFNHTAELPGAAGVLWGDEDVFVICDLAPLADGHLLIVTTGHHTCSGACPERLWPALAAARERVAGLYQQVYGCGLLVFEHGPATPHAAGACIDHAHLHCLPARVRIRPVVETAGLRGERAGPEQLRALHAQGVSYLYVEEDGAGWAYRAERLRGQFLRWAATEALHAAHPGSPGHRAAPPAGWRWQEAFGTPESRRRYLETLERLLASVDSHQ